MKALMFAVLFVTLAFASAGCASAATHYVPRDYAKIQWAIDKPVATLLNITQAQADKLTYALTENVNVSCTIQKVSAKSTF